jgi:hypothetical protein
MDLTEENMKEYTKECAVCIGSGWIKGVEGPIKKEWHECPVCGNPKQLGPPKSARN